MIFWRNLPFVDESYCLLPVSLFKYILWFVHVYIDMILLFMMLFIVAYQLAAFSIIGIYMKHE